MTQFITQKDLWLALFSLDSYHCGYLRQWRFVVPLAMPR